MRTSKDSTSIDMPGPQIMIDAEAHDFACLACGDRQFRDLNGLLNHCQNAAVHAGKWCGRCNRLFVSQSAYTQHVGNSSDHWPCNYCELDPPTLDALSVHLWVEHHYCFRCKAGVHPNDLDTHHEVVHYICSLCEKDCRNQNDLEQVS